MKKMKSGFIGFMPQGSDFFETAKSYAQMGYKAMEVGQRLFSMDGEPSENAKKVRGMGLEILGIVTNIQGENDPDPKELIGQAKAIDVKRVMLFSSSVAAWRFADRPDVPGYDEVMAEIGKMDKLSRALAEEGISLVFHNHDQEFISCYKGVPLFWLMAVHAEKMMFEVDLAWVQYAGWEPDKLITQLGDRVASLHVKDYIPGENYEYKPHKTVTVPRYCAPGAGVVDLYACFKAAVDVGVEWAIIEQDMQYQLTHAESVQAAYYNMKDTGFVV